MTTGELIRKLRKAKGISVDSLANQTGISRATLFRYENGEIAKIPMKNIITIAKIIEVAATELIANEEAREMLTDIPDTEEIPMMNKLPLLGKIACGEPLLAEGNIEEYQAVPINVDADFILRCKGDSMINARIYDGDIVYVKSQSYAENGSIVVAIIEDSATLKRVYRYPDKVVLQPENPAYPPLIYTERDFKKVYIVGKVVGFMSTNF